MYQFIAILVMALVTYLPRVLPVSIFKRRIKSVFVKSLLFYVPYAVLAALTFPSIFYSTGSTITAAIGTAVAIILSYFNCGLVIVALASIAVVFIGGLFF